MLNVLQGPVMSVLSLTTGRTTRYFCLFSYKYSRRYKQCQANPGQNHESQTQLFVKPNFEIFLVENRW